LTYSSIAEISKVRINLFQVSGGKDPLVLPEEEGAQVTLTEKVYVPVKDYPDVRQNFRRKKLIFFF
jgi:protein quaking